MDLLDAVDLPHQLPHVLGQERIGADEPVVAPVDQIEDRIAAHDLQGAVMAAVGLHANDRLARLGAGTDVAMGAGQAVTPDEFRARLHRDEPAREPDDLHVSPLGSSC